MSGHHLLRIGAMGALGRFRAEDATRYPRRAEVIVRTARGLETGEVLAPGVDTTSEAQTDGVILRPMTVQDHLLAARLRQRRESAIQMCCEQLRQRGLTDTTLVDVEYLFDGRSLLFYFLGEITPEVEVLTNDLARTYDAQVGVEDFARVMEAGCGPDCGTDEAAGCGDRCDTGCSLAGACGAVKR